MWIYTYHFFSFNFSPGSLNAEDQSEEMMIFCVTLMYGLYMFIHHPDSFLAPSPTATIDRWKALGHERPVSIVSSCCCKAAARAGPDEHTSRAVQCAWDTWSLCSDKKWHNTTCFFFLQHVFPALGAQPEPPQLFLHTISMSLSRASHARSPQVTRYCSGPEGSSTKFRKPKGLPVCPTKWIHTVWNVYVILSHT